MAAQNLTDGRADTGDREDERILASVEDLRLHFDTKRGVVEALDGVEFEIYEGETLALVGETGCGKTITARSFLQLVPTPPGRYPSGRILFRSDRNCRECTGTGCPACHETGQEFDNLLSRSPTEMRQIRGRRIAMVFQDPATALNPSLRVKNQVAESILAHQGDAILQQAGVDPDDANGLARWLLRSHTSPDRSRLKSALAEIPPLRKYKHRIDELVHERIVEILGRTQIPNPEEVTRKYPFELSGGMQQRVMIAMALVSEPDLLIADEPTTALDVTIQSKILDLMEDLQEEFNTSVLYITHDLTLVEEIADRVAVMYAGQIAEVGTVESIYANPLHPYTWGLLDSIPTADRVGRRLSGVEGSIPDLKNPPTGCRFCTRCPEVMAECSDIAPELTPETTDHFVSCHLYTDVGENDAEDRQTDERAIRKTRES